MLEKEEEGVAEIEPEFATNIRDVPREETLYVRELLVHSV